MDGYLLDTCILEYWYNETAKEHPYVISHLDALPSQAPLCISSVTLGEVEYGHRAEATSDTPVQTAFRRFMTERVPNVLNIRRATAPTYGGVRARLFEKFSPRRKRKGLRPCQLTDPMTAKELGIQENDLWIAAQAVEYGLVLVTSDAMNRIREVAGDLLRVENWARP